MAGFELFLCCLGNGTTVCNKAVMENGDYKTIAHIRDNGAINWYVNPLSYVPDQELEKINRTAENQKKSWNDWFGKLPPYEQYSFLLDHLPLTDFLNVANMEAALEEKIINAKDLYEQHSI